MTRVLKTLTCLCVCLVLFAVLPALPTSAAEKSFKSIYIDVELLPDGSAIVEETWDIEGITSGTEYFVTMSGMTDKTVHSLEVWDETGRKFETLPSWDLDRSLAEKAYTCGIIESRNEYELCWGIGSYGDHTYTIRYTLTGLVAGYTDGVGLRHKFIGENPASPPKEIRVTLHMDGVEFSEENARIWAFGFTGRDEFIPEGIGMWSTKAFTGKNYATLMCAFDSSLFSPEITLTGSFEDIIQKTLDDAVPPEQLERSSSSSVWNGSSYIFRAFFSILTSPLLILFGIFIVFRSSSRRRQKTYSSSSAAKRVQAPQVDYHREIPFGRSLPATYYMMKEVNKLDDYNVIMGCYLLRWLQRGQISIMERKSMFGKTRAAIHFPTGKAALSDTLEQSLYDILYTAAGSDHVLDENELHKWSRRNANKIISWRSSVSDAGQEILISMGCLEVEPPPPAPEPGEVKGFRGALKAFATALSTAAKQKKPTLTELGSQKSQEMLGFMRYLQDFTIINERHPVEVNLWDDYLVFANLFGIADQVAESFRNLYPQYFQSQSSSSYDSGYDDMFETIRMVDTLSRSSSRGIREAQESSSSSSSSYSGGGGDSYSSGGSDASGSSSYGSR